MSDSEKELTHGVYRFDCGCEFPILDPTIKEDGLPSLDLDYDKISLNCPKTWSLFLEGRTKGVFQLEKSLGQHWSKLVEPTSIEHVSDLISILRPGTLGFKDESGKSMAQHYVDRKNGSEDAIPLDPALYDILEETQQVILYQESIMDIAKDIAGFDLREADSVRKAVGKKDSELMAKVRIQFIEKAKEKGVVSDDVANLIFDNIEKSGRYCFNKSHGIAYGIITYYTAYIKAHFPLVFYTAWLSSAREKVDFKDEAADLINDAKSLDIFIKTPSVLLKNENFLIKDGKICYGLGAIKGVGESAIKKLLVELGNLDLEKMTWLQVLLNLSPKMNKKVFENLVKSGAFSYLGIYRQQMLAEFSVLEELTGKHELPWLQENSDKFEKISDGIRLLAETKNVTKARKDKVLSLATMLDNPTSELKDGENWVATTEASLFGTALSCSKLDVCETVSDTTCSEFGTKQAKSFTMSVEIVRISEYLPKQGKLLGQRMLYLTLSDKTGTIEAVAFPDCIAEYDYLLFKGNTVCVVGKKSNKGGLTLTTVTQI